MSFTPNNKKTVELLWTGGYDSTFRIVQLSKLPVVIKPYYLQDNRGICEEKELQAINKISESLKNTPDTRCDLLDIEIVPIKDRMIDKDISAAYKLLKKQFDLGSQYEWLACFAKIHPGIEMSLEKCDSPRSRAFNKYAVLKKINDPLIGEYIILDEEKSQKDVVILFKDYHFPIFEFTKLQMKDEYIRLGCEDVMNFTWFCYTPINGEPCGICNPCNITIKEGLKWRFASTALKRNKFRPVIKWYERMRIQYPSVVNFYRKFFKK